MNSENVSDIKSSEMLGLARAAGRKVTALGGGTGLSTLLLGLKEYTENVTAIVTVTDDGGGSGMLRHEFGVLPPGDIRNCLLALANTSTTMSNLLNYRFKEGSLCGQNFGNLFLLALNNVYGSFENAVSRMHEILAVTGKVLPVTADSCDISALFEDGSRIIGESKITEAKKKNGLAISDIRLEPTAKALPNVLEAIGDSDIIVLGPGSLYTSVIPNLLVEGVADAVRRSPALKIFVMNIMTQEGETTGFSAAKHVEEIYRIAGKGLIDICLCNTEPINEKTIRRYAGENSEQIIPSEAELDSMGLITACADMLSHSGDTARHDPLKLAWNIMDISRTFRPRMDGRAEYEDFILGMV